MIEVISRSACWEGLAEDEEHPPASLAAVTPGRSFNPDEAVLGQADVCVRDRRHIPLAGGNLAVSVRDDDALVEVLAGLPVGPGLGLNLAVHQQEKWLLGLATELEAPFPVEIFARRFDLDLANRITSVSGHDWTEVYAYDPMGNITRSMAGSADGERREYDGTLLTRSGRTRDRYDTQGRLTGRTTTQLSKKPETWAYQWDADDRMAGVRTPDGTHWRYLYNILGRRIAKRRLTEGGDVAEETLFAWDGTTLLEETTTAGSRSWAHDGLRPIAQLDLSDTDGVDEAFYAIITDLVGTPTELITPDGDLVWHTRRTLWGAPTDAAEVLTPLRFPGQYADAETRLSYNLNRYYDPTTGRYASQDPLGLEPAPNPTTYVHNPTTVIDPLGLSPCDPDPSDIPHGPAPENAWKVLDRVDEKGSPLAGYKGGREWGNDGSQDAQILPRTNGSGDPITYQEWDRNPKVKGIPRDDERLVTGSDGSAYYTTDHYKHFIRMR